MFVAHRKSHNIWQLRNGQVIKIFGSLHFEAGHIDGEVDGELLGTTKDGTTRLRFDGPYELHADYTSRVLYIAEGKTRIRRMGFNTDGHVILVTTVAGDNRRGHRDHPSRGDLARFGYPISLTTTSDGVLFVSDSSNHCVRRIVQTVDSRGYLTNVQTTTFVGVPGKCGSLNHADRSLALFQNPGPIITTNQGNLLIADNHTTIRRIALNPASLVAGGRVCTLPGYINHTNQTVANHSLLEVSNRELGGYCEAQSSGINPGWPDDLSTTRYAGFECALALDGAPAPWVAHPTDAEPWFRVRFRQKYRVHRMGWHPFGEEQVQSPQATWHYHANSVVKATHHAWRIQLEFGDGSYQLVQLIDNSATRSTVTLYTLRPVWTDTVTVRVRKFDPPRAYAQVPLHTSFRSTCDVAKTRNASFQCDHFDPSLLTAVQANLTVGAREVSFWGTDCSLMSDEVSHVVGTPGVAGNGDGLASEGKGFLNMPTAMSFQRGREDLYIADFYNNVIRKLDSKGFLSTVNGQPAGDPWKVPGFGSGASKTAYVTPPKGSGKITYAAKFVGPTNVAVATEVAAENRVLVSDLTQKLFVLDIHQQHLDRHCSFANDSPYSSQMCSQAAGEVQRRL